MAVFSVAMWHQSVIIITVLCSLVNTIPTGGKFKGELTSKDHNTNVVSSSNVTSLFRSLSHKLFAVFCVVNI